MKICFQFLDSCPSACNGTKLTHRHCNLHSDCSLLKPFVLYLSVVNHTITLRGFGTDITKKNGSQTPSLTLRSAGPYEYVGKQT